MLSAGSNHAMLTSAFAPVALLPPAGRPSSERSIGTDPWHGGDRHCQRLDSVSVSVLPCDPPMGSEETLKVSDAANIQRRMAILVETASASVPVLQVAQIRWRGRLLAE